MALTFLAVEAALDAGKLEMITPWGAWVRVRPRLLRDRKQSAPILHVFMENQVEATISPLGEKIGYPDLRIAA